MVLFDFFGKVLRNTLVIEMMDQIMGTNSTLLGFLFMVDGVTSFGLLKNVILKEG